MAEAKELMDKLKRIKNDSDSLSARKTKGRVTGTIIGMAGGLLIGYSRGYSLLTSAFIGGLLGGVASYLLLPKEEEDEDE